MPAVVTWKEANGAAGDETTITSLNLGSSDSANLNPATYPVVAGQNSYNKMIKVYFSSTFTKVSNFKIWKSAGTYVTGETLQFKSTTTYTQPATTDISGTAIPTSEPGTTNVGPAEIETAGLATDYIVLQLQTTASSPAGATNTKTITFQYDEI